MLFPFSLFSYQPDNTFERSICFSPTSRYAVNITSGSTYDVQKGDYMIEKTCTQPCTITLPFISGNIGREIILFNNSETSITIVPAAGEQLSGVVDNSIVLPATYRVHMRCNITGWNEY